MESRFFLFMLVLNILCVICVTSRPFATNDDDDRVNPGGIDQSPHQSMDITPSVNKVSNKNMGINNEEEKKELKVVRKIGSSPPSCEDKCYGCMPCEATQVPTTTSRVNVQYANYEPEGWKCKCGPAFYSP